jgi:hypothetical protein
VLQPLRDRGRDRRRVVDRHRDRPRQGPRRASGGEAHDVEQRALDRRAPLAEPEEQAIHRVETVDHPVPDRGYAAGHQGDHPHPVVEAPCDGLRVAAAERPAQDRERRQLELIDQRGHVDGPVDEQAAGLAVGPADPGPVGRDETQAARGGRLGRGATSSRELSPPWQLSTGYPAGSPRSR